MLMAQRLPCFLRGRLVLFFGLGLEDLPPPAVLVEERGAVSPPLPEAPSPSPAGGGVDPASPFGAVTCLVAVAGWG